MDRLVELKRSGEDDPAFGREISEQQRSASAAGWTTRTPPRWRASPPALGGGDRQPPVHAALRRDPGRQGHPARRDRRVPEPDRALPQPVGLPARGRRGRHRVQGAGEGDAARAAGQGQGGRPAGAPVVYGHFAANAEGNDLVVWKDETRVDGVDALHLPAPAQGALAVHRRLLPPGRLGRRGLRQLHAVHHGRPGVGGDGPAVRREPLPGLPLPARPRRRDGRGPGRVLAPADPRGARVRRRGRPDADRAVPPAVPGRPLLVGLPGLSRPHRQRQGRRAAGRATASA